MTEFEKYLYTEYEKHIPMNGITLQASEAFNRMQKALEGDYIEVMEGIEAHYCDKAFQGYKRGFKDGIRFFMGMATA